MATTDVSFSGDIPGALRRASRTAAEALRVRGEALLRQNTPVDSGELLASTYARIIENPGQDLRVELGATAPHAAPVEFGHLTRSGSFVPPNPFLRRSLSQLLRGRR